jgi:hypothetical protein
MFFNKRSKYSIQELYRLEKGFDILLGNIKLFDFSGCLCVWIHECYRSRILSYEDRCLLRNYVQDNAPFLFMFNFSNNYYWKPRKLPPRLKYIKKHKRLVCTEREKRYSTYTDVDLG